MKRLFPLGILTLALALAAPFSGLAQNSWIKDVQVEYQPFAAATTRLLNALTLAGAPLSEADRRNIATAMALENREEAVTRMQSILDRYAIVGVHINPESRVKVLEGLAARELVEQGWRTFLVKVHNEAGITPRLQAQSPHAAPSYRRSTGSPEPQRIITPADQDHRFLDLKMIERPPLNPRLSGLELEYRIIQFYSRDRGPREAELGFHVGQGTQDIGFRNAVSLLFNCRPAVEVKLAIADHDGSPATAGLVVRDRHGRIYPNPARRLAPDFFFHDQVYRTDGETLLLPPGDYTVTLSRGPEYLTRNHQLQIREGVESQTASFKLERWIHARARGWISGDHHVHAAGCAHYENPTEGVSPGDMMRHILGEDLNVGCVLSWGPCWYAQKDYFEGRTSPLSVPDHLMRYDVEVSGFPSSHAGHLCLLNLKEDDYPETTRIEQWPSWTLPVLQWGQRQGGVVGYSHSGWGLELPDYAPDGRRVAAGRAADILPDYAMPPFDGIGANEYVVTVAHGACDFISTVDTPAIWELNIWYHTLNCSFRARISGETDFPCIYGDRVGLGRVYVKLDAKSDFTFDQWIAGVKDGRSYCGDGRSHLFDFRVDGVALGEPGSGGELSQLDLPTPGKVKVSLEAAALLAPEPNAHTEAIRQRRLDHKPYWHLERCRIGQSRKVPVEIVLNGRPVARRELEADGTPRLLEFEIDVPRSSWIAARILPAVHTNPIFVEVAGQPIRASRRSAQWCLEAVDVCWNSKQGRIRPREREAASQAYEQARQTYRRILAESDID